MLFQGRADNLLVISGEDVAIRVGGVRPVHRACLAPVAGARGRFDEPGPVEQDQNTLQKALEVAIGDEDFEKAAELRDRIKGLKTRSG